MIPEKDQGPKPNADTWVFALQDIYSDALGGRPVAATDNFMDIGGHSLPVMEIVTQVGRKFGVTISIKDVFECQTIVQLATLIATRVLDSTELREPTSSVRSGSTSPDSTLDSHAAAVTSCLQEQLWILGRVLGDSATYNLSTALRFHTGLDLLALRLSVERIVERHEVLRTIFRDARPWCCTWASACRRS